MLKNLFSHFFRLTFVIYYVLVYQIKSQENRIVFGFDVTKCGKLQVAGILLHGTVGGCKSG